MVLSVIENVVVEQISFYQLFQIIRRVQDCRPENRPKILGLSATLLNANVKDTNFDLDEKLRELKRVFDGEIITSKNWKEIRERFVQKLIF